MLWNQFNSSQISRTSSWLSSRPCDLMWIAFAA